MEDIIPVSPLENLMREHGLIHRLLLIYENICARIITPRHYKPVRLETVALEAVELTKRFVEEYHQTLEEEYLFPLFYRQRDDVRLVQTLLQQHHAARCISDKLIKILREGHASYAKSRPSLDGLLRQYVMLYAPHAAREDTELFPAFRTLVNGKQWETMGKQFEAAEVRRFGENGFEKIVRQVAGMEQALSINDLNQFTPECKMEMK